MSNKRRLQKKSIGAKIKIALLFLHLCIFSKLYCFIKFQRRGGKCSLVPTPCRSLRLYVWMKPKNLFIGHYYSDRILKCLLETNQINGKNCLQQICSHCIDCINQNTQRGAHFLLLGYKKLQTNIISVQVKSLIGTHCVSLYSSN